MTRESAFIAATLLVAGCGNEMSAEEKARRDAADIAVVEAGQERHPPVEPITPEPITPEDVERHRLTDAGCSFVQTEAPDARPVLVTLPQKAVLKIDGKLQVLAADSTSAELPFGARAEYAGRAYALRLEGRRAGKNFTKQSNGSMESLTIIDQFERPIFKTVGVLDCG